MFDEHSPESYPGILKFTRRKRPKIAAKIPGSYIQHYIANRALDNSDKKDLMRQLQKSGYSKEKAELIISNFLGFINKWQRLQERLHGILPSLGKGFVLFKGRQYSFLYPDQGMLWIALNVKLYDGSLEEEEEGLRAVHFQLLSVWLRIHEELHILKKIGAWLFAAQESILQKLSKYVHQCIITAFKKTEHSRMMVNFEYLSGLYEKMYHGSTIMIDPLRNALIKFE